MKSTRLISLLLAVVMLVSLLPAGFAFAAEEDITLDFSALLAGNENESLKGSGIPWPERFSWNSAYGNGNDNVVAWRTAGVLNVIANPSWVSDPSSGYNRVGFSVNIAEGEDGWYRPVVRGASADAVAAVYCIAPDKASAAYLGDYDFNGGAAKQLNAVYLSEGTNVLVFGKISGANGGAMKFKTVTFEKLDVSAAPTPSDIDMALPTKIEPDETVTVTASLKMSDGGNYSFADYTANAANGTMAEATTANRMEITSSDEDVFTVSDVAKGGSGHTDEYSFKVTGVSYGTADVVFTPYFDGVAGDPITKEIEIKAAPTAPSEITLDFSALLAGNENESLDAGSIPWPERFSRNTAYDGNSAANIKAWRTAGVLNVVSNPVWASDPTSGYNRIGFSVNIEAHEAGWYRPEVLGASVNAVAAVYCVSPDKANAAYLGDYDFNGGAAKKLNAVYLAEGTNVLVFGKIGGANGGAMSFKKVTFERLASQAAPSKNGIAMEAASAMFIGSEKTFTASLVMSDGEKYSFADYTANTANGTMAGAYNADYMEITSSDEDIFTVSNVTKGGPGYTDEYSFTVKGVSDGTANVVFTPYIYGVPGTPYTKEIEIKAAPTAPSEITLDFATLSADAEGNSVSGANISWPERFSLNTTYGVGSSNMSAWKAAGVLSVDLASTWATVSSNYNRIAFNVNVEAHEAGWYRPEVLFANHNGAAAVYCIAPDKASYTYLGDYDYNGGAVKKLNAVYLSAGTNILVFGKISSGSPSGFSIKKVNFERLDVQAAPSISGAELEIPSKIMVGGEKEVKASLVMSDGGKLSMADYTVNAANGTMAAAYNADYMEIASSDEGIFTVSNVAKGGPGHTDNYVFTVKGKTVGQANVIITPYIGGVAQTPVEAEITISEPSYAPYDIVIDFAEFGKTVTGDPSGTDIPWPERFSADTSDVYAVSKNNWTIYKDAGVGSAQVNAEWETDSSRWSRVALDINIAENESGWYLPEITGYSSVDLKASVYNIAGGSATYLGDYHFAATASAKKLNAVYLSEGTNKLVFCMRSGPNGNGVKISQIKFGRLEVVAAPTHSGIEIALPKKMILDSKYYLTANLVMSDGSTFSFADYTIDATSGAKVAATTANRLEITSSDESIFTVANVAKGGAGYTNDYNFTLTGRGVGEADIIVTPYIDGVAQTPYRKTIEIQEAPVAPYDIELDFANLNPKAEFVAAMGLPERYTLETQKTTSNVRTDKDGMLFAFINPDWDTNTGSLYNKMAITFKVNENEEGWYSPVFVGGLNSNNFKASIYHRVAETGVTTYLGDYDFSAPEGEEIGNATCIPGAEKILNTVNLTPGEHQIIICPRDGVPGMNLYLNKLTFKALPAAVKPQGVSAEFTSIKEGEHKEFTAALNLSNGKTYNFAEFATGDSGSSWAAYASNDESNYIKVTSKDERIVVARRGTGAGLCNEDKFKFTLVGVGKGVTEITLTPVIAGEELIDLAADFEVTVTDAEDITIDFSTLAPSTKQDKLNFPAHYAPNTTIGVGDWATSGSYTVGATVATNWDARNDDSKIAIDINVSAEKAGWYLPVITETITANNVQGSVFLGKEYLGDFDFSVPEGMKLKSGEIAEGDDVVMNAVYLSEGVNTLVFAARNNGGNLKTHLRKIVFKRVEAAPTTSDIVATLPEYFTQFASRDLTASLQMSNGSLYNFVEYTVDDSILPEYDSAAGKNKADEENRIEITSSDEGVFTISNVKKAGLCKAEEYNYTLNPVGMGTADIIFTPYIRGVEQPSYRKTVTVDEPARLGTVTLVPEKTSFGVGRDAVIKLSLKDIYGEEYTGAHTTEFVSLDETRVTVTKIDEDTCKVTAIGEGEVTVTATVTPTAPLDSQETAKSGEQAFTIDEMPHLKAITLSAERVVLRTGEVTEFTVDMTMNDDLPELDRTQYTLIWENDNPDVISVEEETGKLRAVGNGDAGLWVYIVNEKGKTIRSEVLEIQVGDNIESDMIAGTVIDFGLTTTGKDENGSWVYKTTPGYTVVDNESGQSWIVKSGLDGLKRLIVNVGTTNPEKVWPYFYGTGSMVTIKVNIPKSDYYAVNFCGGKLENGPGFAVYVDGVTYLGDYDFYGVGTENQHRMGEIKRLNTVYLTKGEHKISFRSVKPLAVKKTTLISLGKLQFLPLGLEEAPVPVGIETNIPELIIDENVALEARLKMSDGSYYHFGLLGDGGVKAAPGTDENNTIEITSANSIIEVPQEDIVSINNGNSGVIEYSLTAKSFGNDEIVFSGKAAGHEFSFSVPVTVAEDPLASTSVEVEKDVVFVGDTVKIKVTNILESGKEISEKSGTVEIVSSNTEVAEISGRELIALAPGKTTVTVNTTVATVTKTASVEVMVFSGDIKSIKGTAGGSKYIRLTDDPNDTVPLYIEATMADGRVCDLTGGDFEYEALNPENAEIDENGIIWPKQVGDAAFVVISKTDEGEKRFDVKLTVIQGKDGFILYTEEMREAAIENSKKYSWAKSKRDSAVKKAKEDTAIIDAYYNAIISEGLPRGIYVGAANDPDKWNCVYCGADLRAANGDTGYYITDIKNPWKIKCTECARVFPSNDFGSFYELGLNEYGEFDRIRALEAHRAMLIEKGLLSDVAINMTSPGTDIYLQEEVRDMADWYTYYGYGVKGGYLYNDLYPEVGTDKSDVELYSGENPNVWCVDDGWGYRSGRSYYNAAGNWECDEVRTFIGFYVDGVMRKVFNAMKNSYNAYLYTGDPQYGRLAAILLDRFADFYPYYDLKPYHHFIDASHGGTGYGNIWGSITESINGPFWGEAYDAVFDLYEDEYVLNYIAEKNSQFKMRHAKETPSQIRTNVEDGILRAVMDATQDFSLTGNYGFAQATVASCAVALDTDPDTEKWLDWLIKPGFSHLSQMAGGSLYDYIIDKVDHDGMGNESSLYNYNWVTYLMDVQKYLDKYIEKYGSENVETNLYSNPKFVSMLYSWVLNTMSNYYPNIGDSGRGSLTEGGVMEWTRAIEAYNRTGNELFLRYIYNRNYGYIKDYNEGIFVKNPEAIQQDILAAVEENGDFNLPSYMMTGFGLAALRGGAINGGYSNGKALEDNRRGIWMFFGSLGGHGHADALNIGIDAFGHNLTPDIGYPPKADRDPQGQQWVDATISHNTVSIRRKTGDVYNVDNKSSQGTSLKRGKTMHFDDAGKVKVMDVDAEDVYSSADIYRRSIVMVEVDDDNAYTVDFFRVRGGDIHEFSFHAQALDAVAAGGLGEVTPQVDENGNYIGTYAGPDVPFGSDPFYEFNNVYPIKYPTGYTWVDNVDHYYTPTEKIEVDFKIEDFIKMASNPSGIRLRATMLGLDTENTTVAIANGYPSLVSQNDMIPHYKYLFVKRDGKNLDSMFTTVYEPYRNTRTLSSIDEMKLTVKAGYENSDDVARAVRVILANGRIDYVFYATNNEVTYTLADGDTVIDFRGFTGVYSLYDGENTYKYICDGDIIGETLDCDVAVTGRITDFTKDLAFENYITMTPDKEVSDEVLVDLIGRYMFIENDGTQNASYMIEEIERLENGDLKINVGSRIEEDGRELMDVGSPTLIRTLKDPMDLDGGYIYNVAKRDDVVIPLSYADENAPVFDPVADGAVSVGSLYTQTVSATAHDGGAVTIEGRDIPRGASFDSETNTFSWKPSMTQVGTNHVSLTATDEFGRETTVHFNVEVFGSTGGGGGGGAGGGDTPSTDDKKDDEPKDEPKDEPTDEPDEPTNEPDEPVVDVPTEKGFVDLGNHAWAEESINYLADEGIIKGTSETTYSPANNITRADYALLLVRAFELESDNTENFADVSASDYFAAELAIARNTGVVNGIGDNKYAPKNTITRQDMMVILYRALTKLGVELKPVEGIDVSTYADYADVADYAKEAVKALVEAGLVNGKGEKLAGNDFTTRAEVAVLLKRVLDYIA